MSFQAGGGNNWTATSLSNTNYNYFGITPAGGNGIYFKPETATLLSVTSDASTTYVDVKAANFVATSTLKTGTPNTGAGAGLWKLGVARTSTGLVPSTTTGLQVDIGGTLYTLAVLSTNP